MLQSQSRSAEGFFQGGKSVCKTFTKPQTPSPWVLSLCWSGFHDLHPLQAVCAFPFLSFVWLIWFGVFCLFGEVVFAVGFWGFLGGSVCVGIFFSAS